MGTRRALVFCIPAGFSLPDGGHKQHPRVGVLGIGLSVLQSVLLLDTLAFLSPGQCQTRRRREKEV